MILLDPEVSFVTLHGCWLHTERGGCQHSLAESTKSTISASTRYTETIQTAKYSVFVVIAINLFMRCRLLESNFLVLCRFVSSAVGHYNSVSFPVLFLALFSAVGHYNLISHSFSILHFLPLLPSIISSLFLSSVLLFHMVFVVDTSPICSCPQSFSFTLNFAYPSSVFFPLSYSFSTFVDIFNEYIN